MIKQTVSNIIVATLFTLTPVNFVTQTVEKPEQAVNNTVQAVEKGVSNSERSLTRGNSENTPASENRSETANEAKAAANERKVDTVERLAFEPKPLNEAQLKKCEKVESAVHSSIENIKNRGVKQLDVFKEISTRTKAFYDAKNYSVATYDQTVAELSQLYDEALVALTTTQDSVDNWNCRSDNPAAQILQLKADKQAETDALNAYKAKVQELIVLVKSAASKEAQ